ncbi:hypothetical protein N7494_013250 [Penicillium frequentans]|uniref:Uncharacterized protein n=1 Tax=Penicillium frequentans TaxID=3151616 RepID=A0AAD6CJ63_9EURO|nr:hypothetical protein N7494_013250 [Penicillium glabrum]
MAPRTRHGQKGEGQAQKGTKDSKDGQALPKQSQQAQPTTAPPEPHLSPTPTPPPPPPPPPKPSEDSDVDRLIRDQIESYKKEPSYELQVNHYARKIKTSLMCDIIEEAARRADMDLNETSEVIAESIDPQRHHARYDSTAADAGLLLR